MIQRLQSIFLFLASGSLGSSFALPFATSKSGAHPYFEDGIFNIQDDVVLLGLFAGAMAICFVSIFLFKNRKVQMGICQFALLLIIGIIGLFIYTFSQVKGFNFSLGLGSPILGGIFTVLALIYIKKDEKLVQSMDRLR